MSKRILGTLYDWFAPVPKSKREEVLEKVSTLEYTRAPNQFLRLDDFGLSLVLRAADDEAFEAACGTDRRIRAVCNAYGDLRLRLLVLGSRRARDRLEALYAPLQEEMRNVLHSFHLMGEQKEHVRAATRATAKFVENYVVPIYTDPAGRSATSTPMQFPVFLPSELLKNATSSATEKVQIDGDDDNKYNNSSNNNNGNDRNDQWRQARATIVLEAQRLFKQFLLAANGGTRMRRSCIHAEQPFREILDLYDDDDAKSGSFYSSPAAENASSAAAAGGATASSFSTLAKPAASFSSLEKTSQRETVLRFLLMVAFDSTEKLLHACSDVLVSLWLRKAFAKPERAEVMWRFLMDSAEWRPVWNYLARVAPTRLVEPYPFDVDRDAGLSRHDKESLNRVRELLYLIFMEILYNNPESFWHLWDRFPEIHSAFSISAYLEDGANPYVKGNPYDPVPLLINERRRQQFLDNKPPMR